MTEYVVNPLDSILASACPELPTKECRFSGTLERSDGTGIFTCERPDCPMILKKLVEVAVEGSE